ncbi:MAG: helix-turn-helix transcriptional regulator [Rhizobiales bacterium]|nr:helix-turn-helix transcriptional regulator [Hyphomicrobiales bacterium]MBO6697358.1 helix-turn-helix transcriptional regulator [Hyphomicrobiales bacterium]MBO6736387.1 helix-turn-helix transcriptional regulator [Hyphomicrobiales bacterium]MBO6912857.1 helix-turn-helix transcriptional regulator [Hyphomicrobiales bacterium]MBO6954025.1 helix-turn-helix transcriptional regulator [Hyphomicrobiales bacterium]
MADKRTVSKLGDAGSDLGAGAQAKVSIYPITQATTATFTELYFRLTFLFFIQRGSKHVLCPKQGEIAGHEGDLMIFPPGSIVTMENRPVMNDDYRALGVCFTHDLVDAVFADLPKSNSALGVQVVRAKDHNPSHILSLIQETLDNDSLPETIKQHRLIEPLLWLRGKGFRLPTKVQDDPISQVRSLIETDLSHPWMAKEVAEHFAMSEATMRRWLSRTGQGFSKILLNTRLERGLALLQTTHTQVSEIALECGFKTPSHFSDAFRKRFGVKPKDIRSAAN